MKSADELQKENDLLRSQLAQEKENLALEKEKTASRDSHIVILNEKIQ